MVYEIGNLDVSVTLRSDMRILLHLYLCYLHQTLNRIGHYLTLSVTQCVTSCFTLTKLLGCCRPGTRRVYERVPVGQRR